MGGPRLGDFGRAGARLQFCKIGPERAEFGFGRGHRLFERNGVKGRKDIAGLHRVAFVDAEARNTAIDTEAERDLADVDIAVKHRGSLRAGPAEPLGDVEPPGTGSSASEQQKGDCRLVHG
ncbi:hypothetical protein D9M72_580360 [compost metagenome]